MNLPKKKLLQMMGYRNESNPNSKIETILDELINLVVNKNKAKIIYKNLRFDILNSKRLKLETGEILNSKKLVDKVKKCDRLIIAVITIGSEIQELIKKYSEEDPLKEYIMDSIGSYVIEKASERFWNQQIKEYKELEKKITSFISPGGTGFPIHEQKKIFSCLEPEKIGAKLTDAYLISPTKSLSLVIGAGKNIVQAESAHDCSDCELEDCFLRGIVH